LVAVCSSVLTFLLISWKWDKIKTNVNISYIKSCTWHLYQEGAPHSTRSEICMAVLLNSQSSATGWAVPDISKYFAPALSLQKKARQSFEMPGTTHPTTQCRISGDCNAQVPREFPLSKCFKRWSNFKLLTADNLHSSYNLHSWTV
jgi:hypothetical protein